jgi:hypothetical protein
LNMMDHPQFEYLLFLISCNERLKFLFSFDLI